MLNLKNKAALEALNGSTVMYRTVTYHITGIVEVAGQYVISTDVKPLRFKEDEIPDFLNQILPVETHRKGSVIIHQALDTSVLTELSNSLIASLREIDTAKDPEAIKAAAKKAKSKVTLSKGITDIAKTNRRAKSHTASSPRKTHHVTHNINNTPPPRLETRPLSPGDGQRAETNPPAWFLREQPRSSPCHPHNIHNNTHECTLHHQTDIPLQTQITYRCNPSA